MSTLCVPGAAHRLCTLPQHEEQQAECKGRSNPQIGADLCRDLAYGHHHTAPVVSIRQRRRAEQYCNARISPACERRRSRKPVVSVRASVSAAYSGDDRASKHMAPFVYKNRLLPRQTRDKHRENSKSKTRLLDCTIPEARAVPSSLAVMSSTVQSLTCGVCQAKSHLNSNLLCVSHWSDPK